MKEDWREQFKNLYFNWQKNGDFFRCVLIPFVETLLEKQRVEFLGKLNDILHKDKFEESGVTLEERVEEVMERYEDRNKNNK